MAANVQFAISSQTVNVPGEKKKKLCERQLDIQSCGRNFWFLVFNCDLNVKLQKQMFKYWAE